ncbi:hypothetical protein RBH26_00705 [Natronolimnohabitans sp. A-GB9]|uniref:cupredoxin domain-containing protein n=1 Tax=Natronolimnohabitans sp. A-GB9 TaxID=3069757 RepID=UPI0027B259D1|nr:hypothetical protein [Natronolimnohabitans sp. A-GB9]MDQ2048996.1 hypothetical protein [Natronolimnohabitans sp. A-GB9]
MKRTDPLSRRTVVRFGGGLVTAGLVAGCIDGGEEGGEPDENGTDELEEEADDEDPPEDEDEDDEWEDVETIELDAVEGAWVGRRPSVIEDVENPDIALYEGSEYEFVWTNTDGASHNLAIWDGDEPITSTSFVDEESETTALTVDATDEMELYLCESHSDEMTGSIEIRSE